MIKNKRLDFISAIAESKPLDLINSPIENDSIENQVKEDVFENNVVLKQTKGNKNFLSEIIEESTSFKDRQTVYVSGTTAKRVKMLSTVSGYDMTRIIDGIIKQYLEQNSDEIKKLMKKFS